MKIFWSWQSDTPGKTGRHFVRGALLEAINELKQREDIEEPTERDRKDAMHLDQDRQGVSGSPDLARTILEKIEASAVLVADVTPVSIIPPVLVDGETRLEKRNMNPNVGIELGYALKALTDRNILMVLNTYYGGREFLPFDLAHKAGPITYTLPPDADKRAIEAEARELRGKLIVSLRPYLARTSPAAEAPVFNETPSTLSAAAYYQANEPLAVFGEEDDRVEYGFPDGRAFYLKLMPRVSLAAPITKGALIRELRRTGLRAMWRNPTGLAAANRYGAIVIEPESVRGGPIKAATQVFTNGQIWGLAPWLLKSNEYGRFVPGQAFETTYRQALPAYVEFMANNLKISPPYTVVAGAVGLEGLNLVIDNTGVDPYGPFYDDEFSISVVINELSDAVIDATLLRIFEELFRLSGYPRPRGAFGFPRST